MVALSLILIYITTINNSYYFQYSYELVDTIIIKWENTEPVK